MTAISYVTNDKGERTALLIDISELKKEGKTEEDINELIEDLENIDEVEKRLRSKGVIVKMYTVIISRSAEKQMEDLPKSVANTLEFDTF